MYAKKGSAAKGSPAALVKDNLGRHIRTEAVLTDISERKKLEQLLLESRTSYCLLFSEMLNGCAVHEAIFDEPGNVIDYVILEINKAYEKFLGVKRDKVIGIRASSLLPAKELNAWLEIFSPVITTGKSAHYEMYSDYDRKYFEGTAYLTEKNKFIVTFSDVTERKKFEQELVKSKQEITSLAKHLENVREKERARIASDLHDDLGQRLTALNMDLSWLISRLKYARPEIANRLISMSVLLLNTIETIQALSTELRPGILDDLGLSSAIEWQLEEFRKRTGIHYELYFPPDDLTISPELSILFFRIIQEALTNISRHARATNVNINLRQENGTLNLIINDNGCGITNNDISNPKSFGIIGMRERVKSYRGNLSITGKKGKGTRIEILIPILSKYD
jgi:PAS domain S-box-containing protein